MTFQGPAPNVPAPSLLLIHLTSWYRTLTVSGSELGAGMRRDRAARPRPTGGRQTSTRPVGTQQVRSAEL